ncbi:MAG: hypothetical protein ACO1RT_00655 [Planctomycetaceae bacterium]
MVEALSIGNLDSAALAMPCVPLEPLGQLTRSTWQAVRFDSQQVGGIPRRLEVAEKRGAYGFSGTAPYNMRQPPQVTVPDGEATQVELPGQGGILKIKTVLHFIADADNFELEITKTCVTLANQHNAADWWSGETSTDTAILPLPAANS